MDLIAILGALAWIPPVFALAKSHFTKPEVRIITQKFIGISFSPYGQVLNIHVAFSVKNQDLVVSNFKAKVTHISGEVKLYEWHTLKQHVMQKHTNEGLIPYEKQNSVLAVKLDPKEVDKKVIQCFDASFISDKRDLDDKARKKFFFEQSKQEGYDVEQFMKCQEATDIVSFIKQDFAWKAGKYKVDFELESPEEFNLVDNEYEFELAQTDIEELLRNKETIEQQYINGLVILENPAHKPILWSWRQPSLYKRN